MNNLKKIKHVKYEDNFKQFADREDAKKYMDKHGYKGYKVIAEYEEFIEVIMATELETY